MPTKPTKKRGKKSGQRGKTSLARIVEKDLEVPTGAAENVKGGKSICNRRNPKLVPIPTTPHKPR